MGTWLDLDAEDGIFSVYGAELLAQLLGEVQRSREFIGLAPYDWDMSTLSDYPTASEFPGIAAAKGWSPRQVLGTLLSRARSAIEIQGALNARYTDPDFTEYSGPTVDGSLNPADSLDWYAVIENIRDVLEALTHVEQSNSNPLGTFIHSDRDPVANYGVVFPYDEFGNPEFVAYEDVGDYPGIPELLDGEVPFSIAAGVSLDRTMLDGYRWKVLMPREAWRYRYEWLQSSIHDSATLDSIELLPYPVDPVANPAFAAFSFAAGSVTFDLTCDFKIWDSVESRWTSGPPDSSIPTTELYSQTFESPIALTRSQLPAAIDITSAVSGGMAEVRTGVYIEMGWITNAGDFADKSNWEPVEIEFGAFSSAGFSFSFNLEQRALDRFRFHRTVVPS